LLVCAVIVVTRNEAWADNVTLFRAGVITSPNSARAQAALAEELQTEADRTPDAATRTALYRQALDHFEKALAIYADDADVLFNEATIYHQTGEPEKALKRYEQTLRISPQYVPALTGLGLVYADRKDYDQAIALFERALDVSPRHADALVNLGAAYQNKGDFSKAIDAYTRSLAVEPNNAIVMMNLANLYNANCGTHFNAGEWSQALSNCTEALKYAPDSANVMTNIGNVYLNMNDVAKATEYYRKALSHDPANEEARERLAQIEATRLH
jgi:Tfp pilus assembly protein PilF